MLCAVTVAKPTNQVQLVSPLGIVEDDVKGHRAQLESMDKDDGGLCGVSQCFRVYASSVLRSDIFASWGVRGGHKGGRMAGLRTVRTFPLCGKIICSVRIAPVDVDLTIP